LNQKLKKKENFGKTGENSISDLFTSHKKESNIFPVVIGIPTSLPQVSGTFLT